MIRVGITGGIGTGKSTVCKIFASMGVMVLDADQLAKNLVETDDDLKVQIVNTFGKESYENGQYNRKHIASIVFSDKDKLQLLNNIIHPAVINYSNKWADEHSSERYIIKEAALMFESGSYKYNDINIVVNSPLELRIERLLKRDQSNKDEILRRINSQMSDAERNAMADRIIINDEKSSLIHQVFELHKEFYR